MSAKVPPLQFRREDIPDLSTGERTDRLLKGLNQFGAGAEALLNGGLTFKANFRAFSKDFTIRGGKAAVAAAVDTAWHDLTLTSDFTNAGTGYPTSRYRLDSAGIVYVQIAASRPGAGATISTLPTGYRPSAKIQALGTYGGATGAAVFEVTSAGAINLITPTAGDPKIVNLSFPAEDSPTGTAAVDQDWPIRIKNEIGGPPSHVFVTRLVDVTESKETPVIASGLSWSADKDQILVHGIGNVFPGNKYRCRILVVAE